VSATQRNVNGGGDTPVAKLWVKAAALDGAAVLGKLFDESALTRTAQAVQYFVAGGYSCELLCRSLSRLALQPEDFLILEEDINFSTTPLVRGGCFGAPGRAHSLGGGSPLLARQGEELAERQGCSGRLELWRKLKAKRWPDEQETDTRRHGGVSRPICARTASPVLPAEDQPWRSPVGLTGRLDFVSLHTGGDTPPAVQSGPPTVETRSLRRCLLRRRCDS
jgi:hypothetical protein